MAALLATTDLEGGLCAELFEGALYLIDVQRQQEIKLLPGASLELLAFLEHWKETLHKHALMERSAETGSQSTE